MKNDNEILETLIAGGIIGAALGVLLSKNNKGEGATLGTLAGAALLATFKASEKAKKVNVPILVEEGGAIYEIQPSGEKKFVKDIIKSKALIPEFFKLK